LGINWQAFSLRDPSSKGLSLTNTIDTLQEPKITLVLGASTKEDRYSYRAANQLNNKGHEIILVGRSDGQVAGADILDEIPKGIPIDTLTIYLGADHQKGYYDEIIALKPERVIFNPGAENPEFETLLRTNNIEVMRACTLVMLSTNQY